MQLAEGKYLILCHSMISQYYAKNSEIMIQLIVDTILEYALKMQFLSDNDRTLAISDLYNESERIYKSDPDSFSEATLMLLGDADILRTEQYQAKMQAAQLWHKNSFDIWVFRIRFFLNINPESDKELLCKKIKAAFEQSEKEVTDLHSRISQGMREAKKNGY